MDKIPFERYRLILKHEFVDADGDAHELSEPYVVEWRQVLWNSARYSNSRIIVNEMMDRLKFELLKLLSKEEATETSNRRAEI